MSIVQLQRDLESVPDQFLAQESQQPSGQYPLYLVAAEIQRRTDLRERFAQQQQMGKAVQPSVVEQRLGQMMQQGIGGAMAPPQGGQMPPQMAGGVMQGVAGPAQAQAAPAPVQGFGQGGAVHRFQEGQVVPWPRPDEVDDWRWRPFYEAMQRRAGVADRYYAGPEDWMNTARTLGRTVSRIGSGLGEMARRDALGEPVFRRHEWNWLLGGPYPETTDLNRDLLASVGTTPAVSPVDTQAAAMSPEDQAILDQRKADSDTMRRWLSSIDPSFGMQMYNQNEATLARMEEESRAGEEDIQKNYDALRAQAVAAAERLDAASAVEDAMAMSQKTPAQLAQERRNRALGQLGALIGGSTAVGDIASGMGNINETLYTMGREQEAEQRDIALALASAKDARELRQTEMLLEIGRGDVAASVGKLQRAQDMLKTMASSRSAAGQAAAQLIDAMSRASAALMAYGTGQTSQESLLDALKVVGELRKGLTESAMGDPAVPGLLYSIDQVIGGILTQYGARPPNVGALEQYVSPELRGGR